MEEVNYCPYYRYGITVTPSGKPITRSKAWCEHPKFKHSYALSDFDIIFVVAIFKDATTLNAAIRII
jgi:hypothetical protein